MTILQTTLINAFVPSLAAPFIGLHTTSTLSSEITGLTAYARKSALWSSSGINTLTNTNQISFDVAGAAWGTIQCICGYSALSAGFAYWIIPLNAAYSIKSGDQLVLDIGTIRVSLL